MSFQFLFIPFERFDDQPEFIAFGSNQCESLDIIDAVDAQKIDTLSICEMHSNAIGYSDVGKCITLTVTSASVIEVTTSVHNPNTISKIQQGVLTGFSIKFDNENHRIIEIAIIDAPTFHEESTLSQQPSDKGLLAADLELFIKSVTHRRLLYLWMIRAMGFQIIDEEIEKLEVELYPDLKEVRCNENKEINQRDIDELQLELSLVDRQTNNGSSFQKATLFRLEYTTVKMRKENNHTRPHIHVQYKNQYNASYAVDNLEQLAGYIPTKYEKVILEWAARKQKSLQVTWDKLQAGDDVRDLVSEAYIA